MSHHFVFTGWQLFVYGVGVALSTQAALSLWRWLNRKS